MAFDLSALPLELLEEIAFKLETFEEFISFSLVCWPWNRAASSIKHLWNAKPVLPWLLLAENTQDNPHCVRKMLNINNENKCYRPNLPETFGGRCWGSPYGWVAMAKLDLTVQLFNPITKANISFPSLETLPYLPENTPIYNDDEDDYYHFCLRLFLKKLIVLKVSHNGHHEFVIMIIYDFHQHLAFARHGDPSWKSVLIKGTKETSVRIFDVVAMDNHVYAIYDDAAIAYWEIKEFFGFEPVKPMDFLPGHEIYSDLCRKVVKVYLIQLHDVLLMVLRHTEEVENADGTDYDYDIVYRTTDFEVFILNHTDKNWEDVDDLGDLALFVGDNFSMYVPVAHAKCSLSAGIYFTDDITEFWSLMPTKFGGHDMGVFDVKSEHISRFYEGDDTRSSFCTPTWFIPRF